MPLLQVHKTAILVFANSAGEEVKYKPIHKGAQLFDILTEHTLQIAAKSELPYFHLSEEQQIGLTFGERFVNAIHSIFDKGFEQIITIGNDTPLLRVSHILETKRQLETKKFVLGPSADGGFYLMGIHKSQFDARVFKDLAWQTSNLCKQLLDIIKQLNVEVFQLQTLFDIDSFEDIKPILFRNYQFPKKLLKALLGVIGLKEHNISIHPPIFRTLVTGKRYNKGSPAQLHA